MTSVDIKVYVADVSMVRGVQDRDLGKEGTRVFGKRVEVDEIDCSSNNLFEMSGEASRWQLGNGEEMNPYVDNATSTEQVRNV